MLFSVTFVLLLTGRLVLGATVAESTVTAGYEAKLKIQPNGNATRCILQTNRGEVLEYKPGYRNIREDIQCIDYVTSTGTCSVSIDRANGTHAGVWKVTAYTRPKADTKPEARDDDDEDERADSRDDGVTQEVFVFNLYIKEKATILLDHIEVYDEHYITIEPSENYENLTACNLTAPKGESISMLAEMQNDDFQLVGQCGIHMKVNSNFSGYWKLVAVDNHFLLYVASFDVEVHRLKQTEEDPDKMLVLRWIRGTEGVIRLSTIRPKICQILDPNGVIIATSRGECYHKVDVATVQHEGVWLARYNLHGMLEPIEERFRIETVDRLIFNTSVNHTENGSTRLLCRVQLQSADYLETCNFVGPNGTTLYMSPVVGNERYTAYVNPRYGSMGKSLECGVTIEKLEEVDYGAWRCNLGLGYPPQMYGSVLHVDRPESHEYTNIDVKGDAVKTTAEDVHVKRGDPFLIKCTVDSALKYCWLRSPNGTAYSVTREDRYAESSFVLHYKGLSYGECSAEISAAVDSDDGQWTCSMGVIDGGEEVAAVSVTVTETYLVAEQTEIAVDSRNDPVLSCHILPRMLDRTVHYCRWIRPDGYGIYNDISHRYTASSSYSQCRLVILNYRSQEDNGHWTCVAGLAGKNNDVEESWAHVTVQNNADSPSNVITIVIVIGATMLLISTVLALVGYIVILKRRRALPKDPPAYNPQEYIPPKSLHPKFDLRDYQD